MPKGFSESVVGSGRRSDNILIRVNKAEKEGFQAAANLAGISLSAWIRERLRGIASVKLEDANYVVGFFDYDEKKTARP